MELTEFNFGKKTPFLKYVKVFENIDENDSPDIPATEGNAFNPPFDMATRQRHLLVLVMDLCLHAPDSKIAIKVRLGGKMWVLVTAGVVWCFIVIQFGGKRRVHTPSFLVLGSLTNDDVDVNENAKRAKGLINYEKHKFKFCTSSTLFVDFVAVIARLRREIPPWTVFIATFFADVVVVVARTPYCHSNPQLP